MRNSNNRSNVLLVEILIAVLFFMLSATVLVRVFATSRNMTVRSGAETAALAEAQNVAEAIYAADDVEGSLGDMGFILSHGAWTKSYEGGYTIYVEGRETPTEMGTLWQGNVRAFYALRNVDAAHPEDEELFSLKCTRYKGGEQ